MSSYSLESTSRAKLTSPVVADHAKQMYRGADTPELERDVGAACEAELRSLADADAAATGQSFAASLRDARAVAKTVIHVKIAMAANSWRENRTPPPLT